MSDRVLVLDDEASILEIIEGHLGEEGYDCTAMAHPGDALACLEREPFALLITDLKMPEMSGLEVIRRARAIDPDLAIIVITAVMEVTNAIQALRSGAYDYLLKPFNLAEMSVAVENALERRRLVIENRTYQSELEDRITEATRDLTIVNNELELTQRYLRNLLDSTVDTIVTVDEQGIITYVNEGSLEMLGYTADRLEGAHVRDFFMGGADEANYLRRMLETSRVVKNYETELKHVSGAAIPVNISLSIARHPGKEAMSIFAIAKDITDQKCLESQLKEMSIKDSLTGLYNHGHFFDRLDAEVERAKRQGHPLSLVLFDLDEFKTYNDCHGHLEGDKVICAAGQVILECTREHVDIGFRYGGDEFTVILPEALEAQATEIAERIRNTFAARRFDSVTLSVGLTTFTKNMNSRALIRYADAMMYEAKAAGGNRVHIYRHAGDPSHEQVS